MQSFLDLLFSRSTLVLIYTTGIRVSLLVRTRLLPPSKKNKHITGCLCDTFQYNESLQSYVQIRSTRMCHIQDQLGFLCDGGSTCDPPRSTSQPVAIVLTVFAAIVIYLVFKPRQRPLYTLVPRQCLTSGALLELGKRLLLWNCR